MKRSCVRIFCLLRIASWLWSSQYSCINVPTRECTLVSLQTKFTDMNIQESYTAHATFGAVLWNSRCVYYLFLFLSVHGVGGFWLIKWSYFLNRHIIRVERKQTITLQLASSHVYVALFRHSNKGGGRFLADIVQGFHSFAQWTGVSFF
jgi:hypothetical protein